MNWLADKIEQWPTAKLVPYARNARTHSEAQVAQIAASIAEFGFTNPKYVDVIVRRWDDFTGQTATLEGTGEPFPG